MSEQQEHQQDRQKPKPRKPIAKPGGTRKRSGIAIIEHRRARVADMYESGMTMQQIADKINVSITTVHHDIAHCRKEWKKQYIDDMQEMAAGELARLDRIYADLARWLWIDAHPLGKNLPGQPTFERVPNMEIVARMQKCIEMKLKVSGLMKEGATINAQINAQTNVNVWDTLTEPNATRLPLDAFIDPAEDMIRRLEDKRNSSESFQSEEIAEIEVGQDMEQMEEDNDDWDE
jgi:hypothetical protein